MTTRYSNYPEDNATTETYNPFSTGSHPLFRGLSSWNRLHLSQSLSARAIDYTRITIQGLTSPFNHEFAFVSVHSIDAVFQQILSLNVLSEFAQLHEVSLIYQEDNEQEVTFYIFTNNDKYDDGLLDQLLEHEVRIIGSYPKISVSFRYIALVLCDSPHDVVAATAKMIYKR